MVSSIIFRSILTGGKPIYRKNKINTPYIIFDPQRNISMTLSLSCNAQLQVEVL